MSTFERTCKFFVLVLAVALLFVVVVFVFCKPIAHRFYPFDRITGTVRVTVDGEPYDLKAGDVTGSQYGREDVEVELRKTADGTKLSMHGGEYGPYVLVFHINGTDLPLEAVVYQYNWYNVTEFELDISIDTAAETVTFSSIAEVVTDSVTEEHTTTAAFSDDPRWHSIVSV